MIPFVAQKDRFYHTLRLRKGRSMLQYDVLHNGCLDVVGIHEYADSFKTSRMSSNGEGSGAGSTYVSLHLGKHVLIDREFDHPHPPADPLLCSSAPSLSLSLSLLSQTGLSMTANPGVYSCGK